MVSQGPPAEVLTAVPVENAFAMPCRAMDDPETGTPMVVPAGRERRKAARSSLDEASA